MMPVFVYPKKYLDELREEIKQTKAKIAAGEQPVFDNVDALFAKLELLSEQNVYRGQTTCLNVA